MKVSKHFYATKNSHQKKEKQQNSLPKKLPQRKIFEANKINLSLMEIKIKHKNNSRNLQSKK